MQTLKVTNQKHFEKEIKSYALSWTLTELEIQDDSNGRIRRFPSEFFGLEYVKTLRLIGFSGVRSLNGRWDKLGQLKTLMISHFDNLCKFPSALIHLNKLEKLIVGNCSVCAFPDNIGRMTSLEWLYWKENGLKMLPDSIGKLIHLNVLNVSFNQLEKLPDSICNMRALVSLYVDQNRLTALPDNIGNLRALTYILASNNPELTKLPPSMGELSALKEIHLDGTGVMRVPVFFERLNLDRFLAEDDVEAQYRAMQTVEGLQQARNLEFREAAVRLYSQVLIMWRSSGPNVLRSLDAGGTMYGLTKRLQGQDV